MKKISLSPGTIYLILSWVGAGVHGKILYLMMLFPSPNPKPKKCSKPPLNKEDWTPSVCYAHWQEPAEHVQKYLLLPQGQEVWPWLPSKLRPIFPSNTHLFSNQSLKCVGQLASRISNIKLCHIVISNHSIYRFIFSKNVKDTVIQHNSSFSFLLSTSLKRNSRSRIHSEVWLPSEGSRSLTVHQSKVCRPRATLARTFKCGRSRGLCPLEAKWIWSVQAELPHPRQSAPRPSPWGTRKCPPSMPQTFGVLLNHNGSWH